ncbi:MAG: helix-turn-helix domain-containing protein [Treponema sp.]|jgi:predicted site-specific integrase-resolvase|nr:helix-turn-helix domain-containing protein [Treponema sp.]
MTAIFNKKAAAKALHISVVSLDRQRKAGKLPCRRIGGQVFFTESDLNTFLENCAEPAIVFPANRE